MNFRLVVLLIAIALYIPASAQTLYNSSTQVGSRFNPGNNLRLNPKVAFDDISIANALVGNNDSIAVGKVNVGIRRTPDAPASDINIYYTPFDDTSTSVGTSIKIPPVLLGKVALPANGPMIVTTVVSVGDGSKALFKMKSDTNRVYPGYHTFFIGISLSNDHPGNAISMTTGPQINKNYIVMYNADSTVTRYAAGFDNLAATFYIQVYGVSPLVLPVTLTNFKGELRETGYNDLSWTTESETNSKGFELQRSVNGVVFDSIAFIATKASKGSSAVRINYDYSVTKPLPGDNFYRLRQWDQDGHFTYSTVVLVKNERPALLKVDAVYPNPVGPGLHVSIHSPFVGDLHFAVTDLSGKMHLNGIEKVVKGPNKFTCNVAALLPGRYTLTLRGQDGAFENTAFLKQ